MNGIHPSLPLLAGCLALLAVVTAAGIWLKVRVADGHAHPLIDLINLRIRGWWGMTLGLGLALLAGHTGVTLLFALLSFAALREFMTIAPTRRGDHSALIMAFFIVLPFQYFLVALDIRDFFAVFIPAYAFLFLPFFSALKSDPRNFMARTGTIQWGLMITVYCVSHVPALLSLQIAGFEGRNVFLIAFLVLIVQGSDIIHQLCSRACGRSPLAPQISQNLTREGFFAGVACATLLGVALSWMTPFSLWHAGLVSLTVSTLGYLGGLVMSAMKRDRGVKDWGANASEAGMLDRIESLCFAAPVYFHFVRHWYAAGS